MGSFDPLLAILHRCPGLLCHFPDAARFELREGRFEDVVRRARRWNVHQQSEIPIEVDQGGRAVFIGFQPHPNRLWPVVFSLEELPAAKIATSFHFRGALRQVIHGFAPFAGPASAKARRDLPTIQLIIHDSRELQALAIQQFLQGFRLGECSWEAIEDEPSTAMEAPASFLHHFPHDGVWYEFAAPHVRLRFSHRRALVALGLASGRPKHISGRKMAGPQTPVQQFGLRPFSYPRRAEQDKPPGHQGTLRGCVALGVRSLKPGSAVRRGAHNLNLGVPRTMGCDTNHKTTNL